MRLGLDGVGGAYLCPFLSLSYAERAYHPSIVEGSVYVGRELLRRVAELLLYVAVEFW